ncbi:MAG: hypothetical protein KF746_19495 [Chitinophagaceae bacterium]|nr:hypothetical protein [Chitinophagaceae bacterium]
MNTISFHDSHVYPGCSAIILFSIVPNGTTVPATAEFSDGSIATAEVEQVSQVEVLVHISAYTTARGTGIPPKSWQLRYDNATDLWKVVAKM